MPVDNVQMQAIPDSTALLSMFDELTALWDPGHSCVADLAPSTSRFLYRAGRLHEQNLFQWDKEAEARTAGSAGQVASCKHVIDQFNQIRHTLVENLDRECEV